MQPQDPYAGKLHITAFVGDQGPFLSVICKQVFSLIPEQGHLLPAGLSDLEPDLCYHQAPNRIGRAVLRGRDLWPDKDKIDLILSADAVAPNHAPVSQMQVRVQFEEQGASATVFGDRHAYALRGQLCFSSPDPFTRVPLDDFHAYGGIDPTLMPESAGQAPMVMGMPVPELFPGANPFNPAGMGYWVSPENFVEGLMLPNVERSGDLLTPERFFVRDPQAWPLAPRPVCWGVRSLWSYPRCLSTNRRPHFFPDAAHPEARLALAPFQEGLPLDPELGQVTVNPKLMQQGAQELALSMRDGPLSLRVEGCFARGPVQLCVPHEPPPIEIFADGMRQVMRSKRLAVHLDTREHKLCLTWACQCPLAEAPRQPGGLADLQRRYLVSYDGQVLSDRCWPGDRAFLHL